MTLIKIEASEYGLEENKAKQISDMFKPMLDRMTNLEVQYNEVLSREIEPETIQMAHDLRLAYVKVRTGTAEIHKKLKEFYLQGGRFVDGWKNAQIMASQGIEERLRSIEDHFVNLEKERVQKLQEERTTKLLEYDVEFAPSQLGDMADDVWLNYISGVRLNYEATKEAERKAEEERIANEKAEIAERARIKKENEQLKKEAEERERKQKVEAKKREKAETERLLKEKAEFIKREAAKKKERDLYELELQKERERVANVERLLKEKEELERQVEEKEKARIEAEFNMDDAAKVIDLLSTLKALKVKYAFKSSRNRKMYSEVAALIDKVIDHINK